VRLFAYRGVAQKGPYLSSGTRGERPASSRGTAGGGKPADNVPDGPSQKGHRATPVIYADEWGRYDPAKEPAEASLLPKREMADTKLHSNIPSFTPLASNKSLCEDCISVRNLVEGIWEVRGGRREFVHSRVMCWVAFDRAIRIAQDQSLPAPIDEWRATRDTIYREIMEKGWNEQKQSFVQYYGSDAIDASALLISLTRFTAEADPRILRTVERIQKELTYEPHVYRYRVDAAADDGLAGHEGTFSICSFWLVEALTRAGRLEEARQNLEQMLTYANHLGLYSEEVGPVGEALGNFPQAFTHLALISACHTLDQALGEASSDRL